MRQFVILLLLFFVSVASFAQKFGYIDSQYILEQLPEYKEAQKETDKLSVRYQKEIMQMRHSLDSMQNAYKREEILMSDEMKEKRMEEISKKEKEIKEFQKKIFGFEGRIFLKRQELIKPLQDKVFDAVEKVAKKHKLQIVFDKASDVVMVYTNPTHDYTDYVLEELGLGEEEDTKDKE